MAHAVADLFHRLTAGVYVVGVADGERRDAFTAAWVMQASFEPLLLVLSINREHASYPILLAGGGFTVNVLGRDQLDLARRFGTVSGRDQDKLAGISWRRGVTGAPILAQAVAYFDCRLVGRTAAGDHDLALGEVVDGALVAPDVAPLTYADTGDLDGSRAIFPDTL